MKKILVSLLLVSFTFHYVIAQTGEVSISKKKVKDTTEVIITKDGKNSFELATDKNKIMIHNYFLDKKENEIYKLKSSNDDLKYKITNLESSLEYTKKSSENYNLKIDKLNTENNSLKRKLDDTNQKVYKLEKDLDESKTAFNNLLKKQRK